MNRTIKTISRSMWLAGRIDVYLVCCNDMVKFAVVGDKEKANDKMEELRSDYFKQNKGAFEDEEEYKSRCRWHIYAVDGE